MKIRYITVSKIKSTGWRRAAILASYLPIAIAQIFLCVWVAISAVALNWVTGLLSIILGVFMPCIDFFGELLNSQIGIAKSAAAQWKKQ